jgi:hypothetical protein
MTEPKPLASLSPTLLARKGAARPAMRPQLGAVAPDALARQIENMSWNDDLGWNDMGHDEDHGQDKPGHEVELHLVPSAPAEVVPLQAEVAIPVVAEVPVVVRQRAEAARRVSAKRRSALADGRRAAFTLRVDSERHLKLRLACALRNSSAQQLITEALDSLLNNLPDVTDFAAQAARRGH